MSEEDAHSYASDFPVLEELYEEEIVSEWEPDYSKTAEYEGEGITSELIPGEGLIAPALAGLGLDPTTAAMVGAVATKKPGMLTNKLFANIKGKKLKANQKANRGVEGPVVTGSSRTLKDSNLRPSITDKTASRYKSMSDRVKKQNATAVGFTGLGAGLVANRLLQDDTDDGEIVTGHPPVNDPYEKPKTQSRNLKGNRDEEGNLKDAIRFTHANGSYAFAEPGSDLADELMAEEYFSGDIAGQNAGKSQSNTGSDWANAEIGVEEPEGDDMPEYKDNVPETMGNQFGYHKREGQNFWTVNNDDPYWDTHVMGTGDAWSDADAKEEVQELDWSSWFK
jgi:hypothetical protein